MFEQLGDVESFIQSGEVEEMPRKLEFDLAQLFWGRFAHPSLIILAKRDFQTVVEKKQDAPESSRIHGLDDVRYILIFLLTTLPRALKLLVTDCVSHATPPKRRRVAPH